MIEILSELGDTVAVNPAHVSMVRGFQDYFGADKVEILFLSGDWRTFAASYDDVVALLRRPATSR